jgi:hypothetical protein
VGRAAYTTANALGEAIASFKRHMKIDNCGVELKSTELEASALMKATYDTNRTADLQLISNAESSIATLTAAHNGRLASLETRTSDLESSVVMKADYHGKIGIDRDESEFSGKLDIGEC